MLLRPPPLDPRRTGREPRRSGSRSSGLLRPVRATTSSPRPPSPHRSWSVHAARHRPAERLGERPTHRRWAQLAPTTASVPSHAARGVNRILAQRLVGDLEYQVAVAPLGNFQFRHQRAASTAASTRGLRPVGDEAIRFGRSRRHRIWPRCPCSCARTRLGPRGPRAPAPCPLGR